MEEIIVTGATGFVGRRVIRELIQNYPVENILCLIKDNVSDSDELEISGRQILKELNVKVKEIDLPSGRGLENLPQNPKLVIHLGASTESGDAVHDCNDIGTNNLLDSITLSAETNFIFTSTAAVYSGRKNVEIPINENTKAVPSNEYGRSKIRAEEILKKYSDKYGFNVTALRLATVWGEGTRKNGLFDSMRKLILEKSMIPRLDWPGKTSLIHVNNVSQTILFFSKNSSKHKFQTYVLSHEGLTLSDISKFIHKNLDVKYEPFVLPGIFWNTVNLITQNSYLLDKILPSKLYNTFWRLNLIVNDSLYCEPDEILRKLPELKIEMIKYE